MFQASGNTIRKFSLPTSTYSLAISVTAGGELLAADGKMGEIHVFNLREVCNRKENTNETK